MVAIVDFIAYLDAFVSGWIGVDFLSNVLISAGQSFTKIRFFGTSFLTRRDAILLAYLQVIIAMIASFYIVEWILGLIAVAISYLIPITLGVIAIFHLYILLGLPYEITLRRSMPALILLIVAILIYGNPEFIDWLALLFR